MAHRMEEGTQFLGAGAAPLRQMARTLREPLRGHTTRVSWPPPFFVLVARGQEPASREGKSDCFSVYREACTPGDRRKP